MSHFLPFPNGSVAISAQVPLRFVFPALNNIYALAVHFHALRYSKSRSTKSGDCAMIYATSSCTFQQYLMKGCNFVHLETSGSGDVPRWIPARMLRNPRSMSVPVFVVAKPGQAWSLGCFAATVEQCRKSLPHLCVVVCKNTTGHKKKLHEASQILCFPTIQTSRFAYLEDFATVVKSNIMMQKALRRLTASITMPQCPSHYGSLKIY